MQRPPKLINEDDRLDILQRRNLLQPLHKNTFTALAELAAAVTDQPVAFFWAVGRDQLILQGQSGWDGPRAMPRTGSPIDAAMAEAGVLQLTDIASDPRFQGHPLVTGTAAPRFFAGTPVVLGDGTPVGVLAVTGAEPCRLDRRQTAMLGQIAAVLSACIDDPVGEEERGQDGRMAAAALKTRLDASEARLRLLGDQTPIGVFFTDASGAWTYANEAWRSCSGLDPEASLGEGWLAAVHPDERADIGARWRQALDIGIVFSMAFRLIRPDGTAAHVMMRMQPARARDADGPSFIGIVEDVTERQLILSHLQAGRERFRKLYESTPAMMLSFNTDGIILTVSEKWLAKLGFERRDVVGRSFADFLAPVSRVYLDFVLPQLFAAGTCDSVELQLVAMSGEVMDIRMSAIVEMNGAGQPHRALAVMEDVSLRLKTERALNEERDRLASIIEGTQAGTWDYNLETNAFRLSERSLADLGFDPAVHSEADVGPLLDRIHPDDFPMVDELVGAHLRGETDRFDIEQRVRRRDGSWAWMNITGRVYERNLAGSPVMMRGTQTDITLKVNEREALRRADQRIAIAADSGGIGIWEWDIESDTLHWDHWMFRNYGLDPATSKASYDLWSRAVHPDDLEMTIAELNSAREEKRDYSAVYRILRSDGEVRYLKAVGRYEWNEQGKALRLVGVNWDVTDSRRLENELAEQHELLRVTLKSIGDAVITTDALGNVVWLNPVAEKLTGWRNTDAAGAPIERVFSVVEHESRRPHHNPVRHAILEARAIEPDEDLLLVSRDGAEYAIERTVAPIRNEGGEMLGAVLVFRDATEQRRLTLEMRHRARHDSLTGLKNRDEFERELQGCLDSTVDGAEAHALLYVDLDQFKIVNDSCGHSVGDRLLQQVTRILAEFVSSDDVLARLGGDEFAIILRRISLEDALVVAQKICGRMQGFRFDHEGRRFRVGASIGLVPVDQRWSMVNSLVQAADRSCYAAKEAGRNRVHVFRDSEAEMHARFAEMQWVARIEAALDDDQFELHGQKMIALNGPEAGIHAESLLRLKLPDGSLAQPGSFMPAAERFHLASRIDRMVLDKAIGWLQQPLVAAHVATLSINLSGQSVGDRDFHHWAMEQLVTAGPALCRRVCLEITETSAVTNLADAIVFIKQLRSIGVRVALDDFGAGASSFGYLKSMPLDYLKIDGQFIRELTRDPLDEATVRCFVDIARVINMKTVAEYVETPEALALLRDVGVDYAQGFLLHRPEPLEDLLARVVDEAATHHGAPARAAG